tara:strand:- start:62 stop:319 length:258 start_codon:yes stop_codon:yes gene_type:complete
MIDKTIIRYINKNLSLVSIIIFLIVFTLVIILKPKIMFDRNNIPKKFGLGYKNKTILPIWLFIIIIAIFSYLFVLYLANLNKFVF